MQAIRNMEPAWEKVNGLKFQLVEYRDAKGELRPITRCQARCDALTSHGATSHGARHAVGTL